MDFDFIDSTYTALLGLFAAVFGIGYPLIIQAMGEIDKRYDSTLLLKCFEGESNFKKFNRILLICIFFAVTTPFALYLANGTTWIQAINMMVVSIAFLRLIIASIELYKLFLAYYHPSELYDILTTKSDKKYLEILDLAFYAAKKENLNLYYACMSFIGDFATSKETEEDSSLKGIIIEKLLRYSSDKGAPEFMKSDVVGISLYFSQKPLKYDLMWRIIGKHIRNGNFDWVMNYWESADQYFTYDLPKKEERELRRFKEFHIALGALLLYNEKLDWLRQIMHFTNQLPPRYELIPCSFTEIFGWLKHFNQQLYNMQEHLYLERHYPFTEHGGVQADWIIYSNIVRYLAYRMLFLDEIDYNVRYMDPMTPPLPCVRDDERTGEKVIPANKKNIELARQLENAAKEMNDIVKKEGDFVDILYDAIDSYIKDCKNAMADSQKNEDSAIDKEKLLKEHLFSEFERQKKILFLDKNPSLDERVSEMRTAKCEMKIRESDIYEGDYRYDVNLESVAISRIISEIQTAYNQIFQINRTSNIYTIRYDDIEKALGRLQLSDQYIVIGFGVNLEQKFATKISVKIKDALAHCSEIIILKKSMMPYVVFCTSDNDSEFEQIEGSCLYSNIGELKKAKPSNDKLILKVLVNYKLVVPQSSIEFIRFRVATEVTDKTYDLDKIVPASDVLQ